MKAIKRIQGACAVLLTFVLIAGLPLAGCSGGTQRGEVVDLGAPLEEGALDTRATAEQTFGAALNTVAENGTEANGASELNAMSEVQTLGSFYTSFLDAETTFVKQRYINAMGQAGLLAKEGNDVIRFETFDRAKLAFGIFAAYDQGPEAMAIEAARLYPGVDDMSIDVQENGNEFLIYGFAGATAVIAWQGFWDKEAQYLYSYVELRDGDAYELDAIKTSYGFASQLYDSVNFSLYRLSFTNDGRWDGGVGFEPESGQPPVFSGSEPLDFLVSAASVNGSYVFIEGELLSVQQGKAGVSTYPITIDSAGATSGSASGTAGAITGGITGAPTGTSATNASDYARAWHAARVVGAGYSERFVLYPDGSFIWSANDMDGANRIRHLAGFWSIQNNNLIMDCILAVLWEGGVEQDNSNGQNGSYGSSLVIANPTTVVYAVEQQFVLTVSPVSFDSERGLDTVTFGDLQCWDYTNQADLLTEDFWKVIDSERGKMLGDPSKEASEIRLPPAL